MKINLFWEHNGDDTLLWCTDYLGAYTRGESLAAALDKMPTELRSFLAFCGRKSTENFSFEIAEEKQSDLNVRDADSDAIFQCEKLPLFVDDYTELKRLALLSAKNFYVFTIPFRIRTLQVYFNEKRFTERFLVQRVKCTSIRKTSITIISAKSA